MRILIEDSSAAGVSALAAATEVSFGSDADAMDGGAAGTSASGGGDASDDAGGPPAWLVAAVAGAMAASGGQRSGDAPGGTEAHEDPAGELDAEFAAFEDGGGGPA